MDRPKYLVNLEQPIVVENDGDFIRTSAFIGEHIQDGGGDYEQWRILQLLDVAPMDVNAIVDIRTTMIVCQQGVK